MASMWSTSASWKLEVLELQAHRVEQTENGDDRVVSTQKPFTLKVALLNGDGTLVDNDARIALKATLLYENGRVVEALNEPTLLGGDALLERGLATFSKLQIRVLSSQRQLQRFRVHVCAHACAHHPELSVISGPLRTLTKIRSRSAPRPLEELPQNAEPSAKAARLEDGNHTLVPFEEERVGAALWTQIDDHGEQLRLLQEQHKQILQHLREMQTASTKSCADSAVDLPRTGAAAVGEAT